MEALGIDIGGSGIKGAPVNIKTGKLLTPRFRIPTPKSLKPEPMFEVIHEIIEHFKWKGPIGCGYPGSLHKGTVLMSGNLHSSWIGINILKLLKKSYNINTTVINDADAAGIAEINYGAGKNNKGTILLITVGTGIGTAVFTNGHLLPNTEFGRIEVRGKLAEKRAADSIRKKKNLSWEEWALRFDEFLHTVNKLIWPDLIILGGGISKKFDKYKKYFTLNSKDTKLVPAKLKNEAGIIGAALAGVKNNI